MAETKKCPHINCAGHEWESWCLDCGERWPNNLHIHPTIGTFNIGKTEAGDKPLATKAGRDG